MPPVGPCGKQHNGLCGDTGPKKDVFGAEIYRIIHLNKNRCGGATPILTIYFACAIPAAAGHSAFGMLEKNAVDLGSHTGPQLF